jgi:hypothetical protein
MTHDDLARSLADHLKAPDRMVWCDLQLGPSGSVRPDVYTMMKSYVRPAPMAYEVKVSDNDFLRDVTAGKWHSYLRYAQGVVFAVQEGLVERDDVPTHCGLMIFRNEKWSTIKRPVLQHVAIPEEAWIKLLIDGVHREGPHYRARIWNESNTIGCIGKQYGQRIAEILKNVAAAEARISDAEYRAKRIIDDATREAESQRKMIESSRQELCDALGMPSTASVYELRNAVTRVRKTAAENPAARRLEDLVQRLKGLVEAEARQSF